MALRAQKLQNKFLPKVKECPTSLYSHWWIGIVFMIISPFSLGSHIVKKLSEKYPSSKIKVLDLFSKESSGNIEYHKVNLTNLQDVVSQFTDADVVFHVAALVDNFSERIVLLRNNLIGTQNIIQACLDCNVSTLIHTTSGSVAFAKGFDQDVIFDGEKFWKDGAQDAYGESKALAEKAVRSANGIGNLKTSCVGFQVLWGEGDRFMYGGIERGEILCTIGDGKQTWSTAHADNAAAAHVLAYEKIDISSGKRWWVQDEPCTNYKEFLTCLIEEVFGKKMEPAISLNLIWCLTWLSLIVFWLLSPFKSIILIPMSPSMVTYLRVSLKFNDKIIKELGFKPLPREKLIAQCKEYNEKKKK